MEQLDKSLVELRKDLQTKIEQLKKAGAIQPRYADIAKAAEVLHGAIVGKIEATSNLVDNSTAREIRYTEQYKLNE